ncbi:MAG: hypothetical protein ACTJLL_01285 [Anaplasma sp.]
MVHRFWQFSKNDGVYVATMEHYTALLTISLMLDEDYLGNLRSIVEVVW